MKFFSRRSSNRTPANGNGGHHHITRGLKWGAALFAAGVAFAALLFRGQTPIPPPLPEDVQQLCGWAGEETAAEEFAKLKNSFLPFQIEGPAQDNAKKRAVLWDAAKLVNGGKHIPTGRQLIGDCVSWGAKHAVEYLQCVEMVRTGDTELKLIYAPYHYATGRCAPECGNRKIRGPDGSVGSWQVKALEIYGVLPAELPGLDPYSASVARRWAVRMPEAKWITEGKKHPVKSAAQVKSADDVRDAICNGYPVTIASSWGGANINRQLPVVEGKYVNRRADTWQHQMCIVGYDGTGNEPYWYILNSWGPSIYQQTQEPPPDDAPPGGFWVRKGDVEFIVRQKDSFAISQFQGFPAQEWVVLTSALEPKDLQDAGAIVRRAVEDRFNKVAQVERN